jgi:phage gpG-like protein
MAASHLTATQLTSAELQAARQIATTLLQQADDAFAEVERRLWRKLHEALATPLTPLELETLAEAISRQTSYGGICHGGIAPEYATLHRRISQALG